MLEERGTPATVVITQPFQTLIATHAAKLGAPGYHAVVVPHPVFGKTQAELQELASAMAERAVAQLTEAGGPHGRRPPPGFVRN